VEPFKDGHNGIGTSILVDMYYYGSMFWSTSRAYLLRHSFAVLLSREHMIPHLSMCHKLLFDVVIHEPGKKNRISSLGFERFKGIVKKN